MELLYPTYRENKKLNIRQIFNNQSVDFIKCRSKSIQFKAFNQERDGIGKLINEQSQNQQKHGLSSMKSNTFSTLIPNSPSDKRIMKVFKVNEGLKQKQTKDNLKLKLTSRYSQQIIRPTVGYYDSAAVEDKLKHVKQSSCLIIPVHSNHFSQQKQKSKLFSHQHEKQGNYNIRKENSVFKVKIQPNYNAEELDRYKEYKRLKLKISENFEENHQKFKQKVRFYQILAAKIKKQLETD